METIEDMIKVISLNIDIKIYELSSQDYMNKRERFLHKGKMGFIGKYYTITQYYGVKCKRVSC